MVDLNVQKVIIVRKKLEKSSLVHREHIILKKELKINLDVYHTVKEVTMIGLINQDVFSVEPVQFQKKDN